jgi:hypothetical protein
MKQAAGGLGLRRRCGLAQRNSHGPFPLTPALPLGERETSIRPVILNRPTTRHGAVRKPLAGGPSGRPENFGSLCPSGFDYPHEPAARAGTVLIFAHAGGPNP